MASGRIGFLCRVPGRLPTWADNSRDKVRAQLDELKRRPTSCRQSWASPTSATPSIALQGVPEAGHNSRSRQASYRFELDHHCQVGTGFLQELQPFVHQSLCALNHAEEVHRHAFRQRSRMSHKHGPAERETRLSLSRRLNNPRRVSEANMPRVAVLC